MQFNKPLTRKMVRCRVIPAGKTCQIFYLPVNPFSLLRPAENCTVLLGPFLFDLSTQKLTLYDEIEFESCEFEPGGEDDPIANPQVRKFTKTRHKRGWPKGIFESFEVFKTIWERQLLHNVSYGTLRAHDGTYTTPVKGSYDSPTVSGATCNFQRLQLLSMGVDGQLLDYLKVYPYASSESSGNYYGDAFITPSWSVTTDKGDECFGFAAWQGLRAIGSGGLPSVQYVIQPDTLQFDEVNKTFSMRVYSEYWITSTPIISNIRHTFTPVWTSRILTSTSETVSKTRLAFFSGLRARLTSERKQLAAFVPKHAHFFACEDAVSGVRPMTFNGIAFIKDLFELKQLIEPVIKLFTGGRIFSPKAWANVLLAYLYGFRLSKMDWSTLISTIISIRKTRRTMEEYIQFRNSLHTVYGTYNAPAPLKGFPAPGSSRTNCRCVLRWEVPIGAGWLERLMSLVEDFDFRISGKNVWDLIPYSFVVNWFTGWGDVIDQWDYSLECDRLKLRERVKSIHNTIQSSSTQYFEEFGLVGQITHDTYFRTIAFEFPKPPLEPGAPSFEKHYFEGILLILSRFSPK